VARGRTGRWEDVESESFDRPRRHTRPRTKERPSFGDAVPGVVLTVDRGRFTCRLTGDGVDPSAPDVMAMKSRPLGRLGVVVGDRVRLVGDTSGADGSLARIVEVSERSTTLRRTADDTDPVERVVVANADQLVVVVALADPEPRSGLVDRALVAAYDAGIDPLLCLTKADLADPGPLLEVYAPLEVPHVVTRRGADLAPVRERLAGRTSVLLGHSGVGKSTLVNALVPGTDRATGVVNDVTGRGRHTSTSALMLEVPGLRAASAPEQRTWIVDTPGIRSFGLAHVDSEHLIRPFPDLVDAAQDCSRGCSHAATEPECGLDVAVAEGRLDAARVASYRRLLGSRDGRNQGAGHQAQSGNGTRPAGPALEP
jgi:ribosome biogenesis GTPase